VAENPTERQLDDSYLWEDTLGLSNCTIPKVKFVSARRCSPDWLAKKPTNQKSLDEDSSEL